MADETSRALEPPLEALGSARASERPSVRRRSMASRVLFVAVSSAALGGLAAAVGAIITVDRLIADQADQRLRAATVTLGGELDENVHEKKAKGHKHKAEAEAEIQETVDDENGEIATSGIHLGVFNESRLVAGPDWLFPVQSGSCETRRIELERVRACGASHRGWVMIAAQTIDERGLYVRYLLAALGAIVLGAGTGALSSRALSGWAVRPLEALSSALRASRAHAPGALDLGRPSEYEEVEAIRSALRELTQRLQQVLDQVQRFSGDAAHELRTPLTALRTELELLAEDSRESERAALERACGRVARLGELVDRLLVLALPTENLRHGFEPVAIGDLIEELARELTPRDRDRLVLELDAEGLVQGDPRLLASLVRNAVENALKFAERGVVEVKLSERVVATQRRVVLTISDEGPGIPRELRTRVFEAFYRAEPGARAGHGLGLALIGHIARAHGGSAAFEEVPSGARLCIVLPAWTAQGATAPGAPRTRESAS